MTLVTETVSNIPSSSCQEQGAPQTPQWTVRKPKVGPHVTSQWVWLSAMFPGTRFDSRTPRSSAARSSYIRTVGNSKWLRRECDGRHVLVNRGSNVDVSGRGGGGSRHSAILNSMVATRKMTVAQLIKKFPVYGTRRVHKSHKNHVHTVPNPTFLTSI